MPISAQTREELSPIAAGAVVAGFVVGAVGGFSAAGLFGAFMGALGGAGITAAVVVVRRLGRQTRRLEEPPAVDLRGLPPSAALSIMSATGGDGARFASELLTRLQNIEDRATDDAGAALRDLDALQQQHPRSPALWASRARIFHRLGRLEEAALAASRAITWGLDKGMNPMAARTFTEQGEMRGQLQLDGVHWERLARALDAQGRIEDATWCRNRVA